MSKIGSSRPPRGQRARLRARSQPELKTRKSERTRAAILNAALDFLWSHPFHEMTVNSVMASTGAGRSAFYAHFKDLHELMETLLKMLQDEIFAVVEPWLEGSGDPVALLDETLTGLIQVCYQQGPFLRAISDAATTDDRLGKAWQQFLGRFDDVGYGRIVADQEQGLIPDFDPRPVIIALNRLNAYTIIKAFGQHPRRQPKPVGEALARIWISTLYGPAFVATGSSTLVRK
jgi:AcrR family transcriptional regulator